MYTHRKKFKKCKRIYRNPFYRIKEVSLYPQLSAITFLLPRVSYHFLCFLTCIKHNRICSHIFIHMNDSIP